MTTDDRKAVAYLRTLIDHVEAGEATIKRLEIDAHVVEIAIEGGKVARVPTGQHVMEVVYMKIPKPVPIDAG